MNAQFARARGWPGEPFSRFGTPNLKRRMARDITPLKGQVLQLDFILLRRHVGLPRFLFLSLPFTEAHVQYDLDAFSCTISISEPHILQYLVLGEFRSLST